MAIFGFCDVRNFTDVTECLQVQPTQVLPCSMRELSLCFGGGRWTKASVQARGSGKSDSTLCATALQEDIMVFINCIAEYVHTAVADNGGFPNKNIGAAHWETMQLDATLEPIAIER